MRFIFNFFFFGLLFYLIWMFFPDAFHTLVSWANQVVDYFSDLIRTGWGKNHVVPVEPPTTPSVETAAWMLISSFLGKK